MATLLTGLLSVVPIPRLCLSYWRGSVLGPLLFLIYINDVTCVVNNSGIVVFADDIALYKVIQSHLDYYLYYSLTLMPSASLNINDIELSQVTAVKYLGITFTQDGIDNNYLQEDKEGFGYDIQTIL